jgi:methylmalonyl-CoA/ethylmalonyl-CoA epimerase
VRRFLQKRGEGIHHLCFEVEDVGRAAEEVRERGCRVLWPEARPGSGGRPVQFLHPADAFGTLVELVEAARERFA